MYTFLLVLLIIDAFVLVLAILLQSGKGGGLAASFGGMTSSSDALFGTRQAGNLLTRASWWSGGIFLFLAFVLSLMSNRAGAPTSVFDETFSPAPVQSTPAPATQAPAGVPLEAAPVAPAPGGAAAPAGSAPQTTPTP
jgi:preprotein translocase subunit SecG